MALLLAARSRTSSSVPAPSSLVPPTFDFVSRVTAGPNGRPSLKGPVVGPVCSPFLLRNWRGCTWSGSSRPRCRTRLCTGRRTSPISGTGPLSFSQPTAFPFAQLDGAGDGYVNASVGPDGVRSFRATAKLGPGFSGGCHSWFSPCPSFQDRIVIGSSMPLFPLAPPWSH